MTSVPSPVTGWPIVLLLFLLTPPLEAQSVESRAGQGGEPHERGSASPALKEAGAARITSGAIRVDGILDDDAWAGAAFHSDFHQKGADREFEPRVRTEVAFLYDDEALYVGARMQNEAGRRPRALLDQRDSAGSTERVLVSLDTYRDGTSAYTFGVTIGGVRVDYLSSRDNEGWVDASFDPVWQARVASDSAAWTAEMRVPFSQLRFTPASDHVWGLNVRRWNPAASLNVYWVVIPYDQAGWASRFGVLRGIRDVAGGASVEVTPYVVGRATRLDSSLGGSPDPEMRLRAGGDAKVGLGSNLTLDATLNPDFGQVEADPARVNLSAFETFFPERRPFFLEGQELFRGRGPSWFYSRRIGSLPAAGGSRSVCRSECWGRSRTRSALLSTPLFRACCAPPPPTRPSASPACGRRWGWAARWA
jgi:hypothetical protein